MDAVSTEKVEILLSEVMKNIHSPPSRKPVLHNITFAQMKIMWILATHGRLSMSQIAEMVGVSRATISSIVGRLVKSKFVSRITDRKDRRITRVCLGDKGRKFIEIQKGLRRKRLAQLLDGLSLHEQKRLVSCLDELNELISKPEKKL